MTRSPKSPAVGVLGTGLLGTRLAERVRAHPHFTLDALSDIDTDSIRDTGEQLAVPETNWFTDYNEMLASVDLDAVVIATPHTTHFDQIRDALETGHHVLCEKPLCTTVENARRIDEFANRAGKTVMVGYQRRVEAPFVEAKRHLDETATQPMTITAEITQPWITDALDSWRGNPDLSGGGFLFDTGSHLLDAVLWLTNGTPTSVSAEMDFADEAQRIDEHASITIRFDTGAIATLSLSARVPRTREFIRVWTDQGAVEITGREWNRRDLTVIDEAGNESSLYLGYDDGPGKVSAFYDAVTNGDTPPSTVSEAILLITVTQAAYKSARTGRTVDIPQNLDASPPVRGESQ